MERNEKIGVLKEDKMLIDYLGGGDVEALHTPNRGVETGLLSLRNHAFLQWLLKFTQI